MKHRSNHPRTATLLLVILVVLISVSAQSQDIGIVRESGSEPTDMDDIQPIMPYKLSIAVKPLPLLLLPVTGGAMGNGNIKLDYALSRTSTVALAFNYFRQRPFSLLSTDWEAIALKFDYQIYMLNPDNYKLYAEGFHFGPYVKLRYEEVLDPNGVLFPQGYAEGITGNGGGLMGYKVVANRFVFDTEFGVGLGYSDYTGSAGVNIDLRAGIYLGFVAL